MFQFLDDAIHLLDGIGDRGSLVRRLVALLLVMPLFVRTRSGRLLLVRLLFVMPLVGFVLVLRVFDGWLRGLFSGRGGRGRFAWGRRGQGTARLSSARMAAATAP